MKIICTITIFIVHPPGYSSGISKLPTPFQQYYYLGHEHLMNINITINIIKIFSSIINTTLIPIN